MSDRPRADYVACDRCGRTRWCVVRAGEWVCPNCRDRGRDDGQLRLDEAPTPARGQTEEIPY